MKNEVTPSDYDRSEYLKKKIYKAFSDGDFAMAKAFINIQLDFLESARINWNHGNLKHQCYTYLGLMNVQEGDIEAAKVNLLKSIDVNRTPQLKTFGPMMILAQKLLEEGERDTVLLYLSKCGKVWNFIFSFYKLSKWKSRINRDEIPDFGIHSNLYLHDHEKVSLHQSG